MKAPPRCTECGQPVTCGQGTRHLSCSPLCPSCFGPIQATGHKCPTKKQEGTA